MRYRLRFILILIMGSITAIAVSANAQMYEYRDSNGIKRVTDNLGNVPADRRENAQRIQQIPRDFSPDPDETFPEENNGQQETDTDLVKQGEALRQEQAELQEEYESIEKEKAMLGAPPAEDAPRHEFEAYRHKIEGINSRIKVYQEKLEDYENRVEGYNARF